MDALAQCGKVRKYESASAKPTADKGFEGMNGGKGAL